MQTGTDPFEGCRHLCSNAIPANDVVKALTILSAWVVPVLALVASFPYESLKQETLSETWRAISYRIGSPQATYTATVSNLHNIKICRIASDEEAGRDQVYRDVFYILSCLNQYDIFGSVKQSNRDEMIRIILHGLLLPLRTRPLNGFDDQGILLTRDLIRALAFKMKMLRRRGVYP